MNGAVLTYWWAQRPNWGDLLAPLVLARFAGITAVWAPPQNADLVCVGSVLDVLPLGWAGVVAGSGVLHEGARVDLRHAIILGLRGKLTWELAQSPHKTDAVLGDPGLLISEIVPRVEKRYDLGVVPHWTDVELAGQFRSGHYINPAQDPLTVIREIAACDEIVASSLHGVIVADAFGIPRRVELPAPRPYESGRFKIDDYHSALPWKTKFGEMQHVPDELVDARQSELFTMFERLPDALGVSQWATTNDTTPTS